MTRQSIRATYDDDEFLITVGTGMKSVEPSAGAEFSASTADRLHARLDEFDAVRTRGEVEIRSIYFRATR